MKRTIIFAIVLSTLIGIAGCGKKSEAPPMPRTDASTDTHPVKNVDALPAGSIREGGKLMNKASDLGKTMEQQKEDREKGSESK